MQPVKVDEDAKSVFESTSDITAPGFDRVLGLTRRKRSQAQRWKFKGPWLVGKTENAFKTYLEKEIPGTTAGVHQFSPTKGCRRLSKQKKQETRWRMV